LYWNGHAGQVVSLEQNPRGAFKHGRQGDKLKKLRSLRWQDGAPFCERLVFRRMALIFVDENKNLRASVKSADSKEALPVICIIPISP
jgi:hypothetical protein